MMKSRTFTIFLLTENTIPQTALVNHNTLEQVFDATEIPPGALLYLTKGEMHNPWWKGYLGISKEMRQSYPGGILFIPVENRWFAATFGQSYHQLSSASYEYDFGLKTSLNAVDRASLRSTDVINPETAKRERIQAPRNSNFSFFSFDSDSSTILKRISGRVQEQYQGILTNVTGCDSIRVTTKKTATELAVFCQELLKLYFKQDAVQSFPEVFNIRPEKTSSIIKLLDEALLAAIKNKKPDITLSYPDMLDYQDVGQIRFGSLEPSNLFTIESFWEQIPDSKLVALTVDQLKRTYNVNILNIDGAPIGKPPPSLYKCLIFEYILDEKHYHFCEGKWYCVNQRLVETLRDELDPYFKDTELPGNTFSNEAEYNKSVSASQSKTLLCDRKNFTIKGQTPIELCDLCQLGKDNSVSLIHVKVGVHSSRLSHLFSQGYVASKVLVSEPTAVSHFEKSVEASELDDADKRIIINSIKDGKFSVIFAIITKKSSKLKSEALPLFSRINLRRAIESLKLLRIKSSIHIVADNYTKDRHD